ncbi:MAG: helix-hairpin-helix domain-containing protein [Chitinophagaceae bacterium]|jgi:competence protein ComEA
MNWKEFATDYLSFSKKEQIAVFVLVALIVLVFLAPTVAFKKNNVKAKPVDTAWMTAVKNLELKSTDAKNNFSNGYDDNNANYYQYDKNTNNGFVNTKGELFEFDPNTLSPEGWKKLGLRDKTINTIQNYLNKGGRFKAPEDVKKIYGLFPNEYERIAPHIRISNNATTNNETIYKPTNTTKSNSKTYRIIEINMADTSDFISLPGIGSKLAWRIVNFRDKLGGFYNINQIAETYGLPDSTFQKIKSYLKLTDPNVKKININTASVDELKTHPYIRYQLARPIVAYREQHGLFSKPEDLKKIMIVTDEVFLKIAPYLQVQ